MMMVQTAWKRLSLVATLAVLAALCVAGPADAYVYWVDPAFPGTIGRANLDGAGTQADFVPAENTPQGIAVDGSHIYWSNFNTASIGRANLDGTDVEQHFITGASYPSAVAVDGTHLYWANKGSNTIGRASLDGTGVTQTFIAGANVPQGLAVDAEHIYWANSGSHAIGRANIGGGSVQQGFISGLSTARDVAVDGLYVYWTSPDTGRIGRANLDGTGVEAAFIADATDADAIAVDGGHLYWSSGGIERANLDGTGIDHDFIPDASAVALALDGLGPPPPMTLVQGPPTAATVAHGAGYSGQLTVTGAHGAVSYTETPSTHSSDVVVSPTGAISAARTLPAGVYAVAGRDKDATGDIGAWHFTLTVNGPVEGLCFRDIPPGFVITEFLFRAGCGAGDRYGFNAARVSAPADDVRMCEAGGVPRGYVVIAVDSTPGCGPVFANLQYNRVQIHRPVEGLIKCDLGGFADVPAGYVVTHVYAYGTYLGAGKCGIVFGNIGYNAIEIHHPAAGMVICDLGGNGATPAGYVITEVLSLGTYLGVGQCGTVAGNVGYNALRIAHPSDGMIICELGITIPVGYSVTHVYAYGTYLAPGKCGYVYGNDEFNAARINLPKDGLVICAQTGIAFIPAGYVVTADVITNDCGGVYPDLGFNAFRIGVKPAGNVPTLTTTSMIAGASGRLSATVYCPESVTSCTGSLKLQGPAAPGQAHAAAAATLATGSFKANGGQTATVKLRLNARARRLIRRTHAIRARATLLVHELPGGSHTSHENVTIHVGAPGTARLAARLRRQLAPSGRSARIPALVKRQRYALPLRAPSGGKAVIQWYYLPNGARPPTAGARPMLVAEGTRRFAHTGKAKIAIRLNAEGRRLLAGAKRLKLTAQVAFTPTRQYVVTATKTFTLRR